jgi:hypothetical protein
VTTTGKPPHVPGNGDKSTNIFDSKTIGNIKRILALPCDTPPSIWIETAVPAILGALWDYESFDPRELYHKSQGHSALCEVKGLVKQSHLLPPEHKSNLTKFVFRFFEVFDLITWYTFLLAIAADGVYNWSSGILRMSPCSDIAQREGSGFAPFGGSFDGGQWGSLDFFMNPGRYYPATSPGFVLQPGEQCMIAVSCTFQDVFGVPVEGSTRIHVEETGEILDEGESHLVQEPLSFGHMSQALTWAQYSHRTGATGTRKVQWQCTHGGVLPDHELFPKNGFCFIAKF